MSIDKSEGRFEIITYVPDELGIRENRTGDVIVLKHRDLNSEQFVGQIVMFLNDQNDAIGKLINDEKYWEQKAIERITELEKENKELKEENETLKIYLEQANSKDKISDDSNA